MRVFLNLPQYLKEWVSGRYPRVETEGGALEFPRGSIEATILLTGLRAPRAGESVEVLCPEGWTAVRVPGFRGVDLTSRNYLPEKSRIALEKVILRRFDLELWELTSHSSFRLAPLKEMLEGWMESRGIELTEPNYWAIAKRAVRQRRRCQANIRQQRCRGKNKKND